jgi:endonuclease/exonuclease/phosphatase family metal-dependent hydrolase
MTPRVAVTVMLLAAAGCATAARAPGETAITVATYNIQAGAGNLDRISDEIRAMNADLVALQEVDVHWHQRSSFVDQATALGKSLGVEVRFAPIYRLAGGDGRPMREFGVALLSKHPIESFRNDSLTRLSTQETNPVPSKQPGLLNAIVTVRGQRVRVLTAHLDYRANPSVRIAQVAEIVRVLEVDAVPTILAGDLNATPDAAELRPLFTTLADAWRSTEPGYTYPASAPTKRIDYILISKHFGVRSIVVPPAAAADHRPVIASLTLVGR